MLVSQTKFTSTEVSTLENDYHSDSHDPYILDILKWNAFRLFEQYDCLVLIYCDQSSRLLGIRLLQAGG